LGARWVFGSILCSLGALIALPQLGPGSKNALFIGTIVSGVGLAMVALPSLLTIRADHEGGFLTLTYRSLLTKAALKLVWRPEVQRHPPRTRRCRRTDASFSGRSSSVLHSSGAANKRCLEKTAANRA
jgi:hypothetical protein